MPLATSCRGSPMLPDRALNELAPAAGSSLIAAASSPSRSTWGVSHTPPPSEPSPAQARRERS